MSTLSTPVGGQATYPVRISVEPALEHRNRLTTAFRFILVLPHLLLVGGPAAAFFSWNWSDEKGWEWTAATGVLGAVAGICAFIAWFAILFTGRHPDGLWRLSAFYLRWRVRVSAYAALLRDEYPPFGDDPYPATLELRPPEGERDRLTVALRVLLALPHLLVIWLLGIAWGFTTLIAWFAIVFTGRFPAGLYRFSLGLFRWITRVEAYLLLLHDEYPPFSLE
ncbi:MAG TPA: DUF4389 domain-containing protein [Gemmatimonadaceae bacterium]|nr:DUF4389 domain-containing protein [Gemmatimonadaceae bacterium]